jgi:hypothetical protein
LGFLSASFFLAIRAKNSQLSPLFLNAPVPSRLCSFVITLSLIRLEIVRADSQIFNIYVAIFPFFFPLLDKTVNILTYAILRLHFATFKVGIRIFIALELGLVASDTNWAIVLETAIFCSRKTYLKRTSTAFSLRNKCHMG